MNSSLDAVTCGTSNTSSVKPVSAPSASATSLIGMLMLMTPKAAWMASSTVARFRRMCFRSPTPYTTVDSPTARYGAIGLGAVFEPVRVAGIVSSRLRDGADDALGEVGVLGQGLGTFGPEPPDESLVLVHASLALVQAARLEEFRVVDAGDLLGHLVTEVVVSRPFDRLLGDGLHHGRGVGDLDIIGTVVVGRTSHADL